MLSLVDRAKNRCRDCPFVAENSKYPDNWTCDDNGKLITDIIECVWWDDDRGDINNPEWSETQVWLS